MPVGITTYRRRPDADRNELALAALQLCRTLRGHDDITSSRLFWDGWNDITIITEGAPTMWNQDGTPNVNMMKATSGLADLADVTSQSRLAEAKAGQDAYDAAERPSGS
jgi:hypothetical protein